MKNISTLSEGKFQLHRLIIALLKRIKRPTDLQIIYFLLLVYLENTLVLSLTAFTILKSLIGVSVTIISFVSIYLIVLVLLVIEEKNKPKQPTPTNETGEADRLPEIKIGTVRKVIKNTKNIKGEIIELEPSAYSIVILVQSSANTKLKNIFIIPKQNCELIFTIKDFQALLDDESADKDDLQSEISFSSSTLIYKNIFFDDANKSLKHVFIEYRENGVSDCVYDYHLFIKIFKFKKHRPLKLSRKQYLNRYRNENQLIELLFEPILNNNTAFIFLGCNIFRNFTVFRQLALNKCNSILLNENVFYNRKYKEELGDIILMINRIEKIAENASLRYIFYNKKEHTTDLPEFEYNLEDRFIKQEIKERNKRVAFMDFHVFVN